MKSTTAVWMAVASLITAQAWAADFYVNGTTGNDTWNGQSPVYVSGTIGPRATINGGIGLLGAGTGNVLNVAAGAYSGTALSGINGVSVVGAGSDVTTWTRTSTTGSIWNIDQNGTWPTTVKGFTLSESVPDTTLFISGLGWGGAAQPIILDDVRITGINTSAVGFRLFNSNLTVANGGIIFKDVDIQNVVTTGGSASAWRLRGVSAATPFPLVFDGGTWSDNVFTYSGTMFDASANVGSLTMTGFTVRNNSRTFNLNRTVLGVNLITDSLFQDNPTVGLPFTVGVGADVIVQGSTFRNTAGGFSQATGMSMTVPAGNDIGKMRFIDTVFDGANTGITLSVAGAVTQTHPIELKNVDFGTASTGLNITGAGAGNIWYIDPTQSGASGTGTLVSGGQMTVYGDASLDGMLTSADMDIFWTHFPYYGGDATWMMGDFNMDGNVDVFDMGYMGIPEPGSLALLALAGLLACRRRRRRA